MKKCRYCSCEGEENEFVSQQNVCRLCNYFKNNEYFTIPEWCNEEKYMTCLYCILNAKISCVNDLIDIVNLPLHRCIELCKHIGTKNGNCKIKVEYECDWCKTKNKTRIYKYENNSRHYCNSKCRVNHDKYLNSQYRKAEEYNNIECEWCKNKFHRKPYHYNKVSVNLCSKKCRQEWFREVYSKSEEAIQRSRTIALNNLANGVYNTDSDIQLVVNGVLDKNNIKHENEKIVGYYAFDNYLVDYDLYIEVQGGYWHCDPRKYENIRYDNQKDRISRDKSKATYCSNNNMKVLYLWEDDILNNTSMCEKLIIKFIKGNIKNNHSFNYQIKNDKLIVNKDIIIPYSEMSIDEVNKRVDNSVLYKKEYYNTVVCNHCGNEFTKLKSKDAFENSYCSRECSVKGRITKVKLLCDYCGEEIYKIKSEYESKKNHFCNKECHDNFQRTSKRTIVFCDCCGKEFSVINSNYKRNKSKKFYCNEKCYLDKKQKRVK